MDLPLKTSQFLKHLLNSTGAYAHFALELAMSIDPAVSASAAVLLFCCESGAVVVVGK